VAFSLAERIKTTDLSPRRFLVATVLFRYITGEDPTRKANGVATTAGAPANDADPQSNLNIDRWWRESSYELSHGLDVEEDVSDTVPGDLLDELFKR